jgi:hypothetical protein
MTDPTAPDPLAGLTTKETSTLLRYAVAARRPAVAWDHALIARLDDLTRAIDALHPTNLRGRHE